MEDSDDSQLEKQRDVSTSRTHTFKIFGWIVGVLCLLIIAEVAFLFVTSKKTDFHKVASSLFSVTTTKEPLIVVTPTLNKTDYNKRMMLLANRPTPVVLTTSTSSTISTSTKKQQKYLWPVNDAPYPDVGAILPFKRILAYYGNFYSTGMGILGEYPEDIVLQKLRNAIKEWKQADTSTPIMPAIEYIAFTAQASAGKNGKYSARMPSDQIDHAIEMAKHINGIVILDVQAGTSNIQKEIHLLEPYLKLPQVHLAIDPEFNMKYGNPPGTVVGTVDATDINATTQYLASLVQKYKLPPKILVIHRFTERMITHTQKIHLLPEVQIVMDMDGWGSPAKKINTYDRVIYPEPVQFTGIKLFYRQDLKLPSTRLLTPLEVLRLRPIPIFIQYQ